VSPVLELIDIPQPQSLPLIHNGLPFVLKEPQAHLRSIVSAYPDGLVLLRFPKSVSPTPIIVCSSTEAMSELHDDVRFPKFATPITEKIAPTGLFTSPTHNPAWAVTHRTVLPALSGPQLLHDLPILQSTAHLLTAVVVDHGPKDGHVDIEDALARAAFDAICQIAFRTNYGALFHQPGSEFFDTLQKGVNEIYTESVTWPFLWRLKFLRRRRQAARLSAAFAEVDAIIENRRRMGSEVGTEDLLGRLLWPVDPEAGLLITEDVIRDQVLNIAIVGQDSTKSLMTWVLYHLSAHPDIQRQVQGEIDAVTGGDQSRPLSASDLAQLHLLDRVLSETLRLTQPFGAISGYAAQEETLLGKYRVPQNSVIVVLRDKVHTDPANWTDPELFDPDRWLPERLATITPGSYLPFSAGIRACIGQGFAHMEAMTFLSSLLRAATFHLDGEYSFDTDPGFSLSPLSLETLRVTRREPKTTGSVGKPTTTTGCPHSSAPSQDVNVSEGLEELNTVGAKGSITVGYGSDGGTCLQIARRVSREAARVGLTATIVPLDSLVDTLPMEDPLIIVCSSYNGAPPSNAIAFRNHLKDGGLALSSMRAAVLGVGDPAWHLTFQEAPTQIDTLLRENGCTPLIDRGIIDVSQDFTSEYLTWTNSLWGNLGLTAPTEAQSHGTHPDLSVSLTHHPAMDAIDDGVSNAYVASNRELLEPRALKAGPRSTRHVEITLPEGMTYETGDHLIVSAFNHRTVVDRALDVLGIKSGAIIEINPGDSAGTWLPTEVPVDARFLFEAFIDFGQPISAGQMAILAEVLTGSTGDSVRELAALSPEEFNARVFTPRLTLLDLLTELGKPPIPLDVALRLLSPLKRRRYSISSSPLVDPGLASITVGVVRGTSFSGNGTFRGVASSYLNALESGQVVHVAVASSGGFQPPLDPSVPIIMIGAGTGIAPFRGFAHHRAGQRAQGHALGESLLLAGCRRSDEDRLYLDEWESFEREGIVEVKWAFSREPVVGADGSPTEEFTKTYVQDLITAHRSQIDELLSRGAIIYICGDASGMATGVRNSLGSDVVDDLRSRGQLLEDVWSNTFSHL
jgi:cytochrome P450 / NADPH-cytochrome P450 reductase